MCNNVVIHDDKRMVVTTIGQLAKHLGGREKIVINDGYEDLPDDCCLCPINEDATAAKNGYSCDQTDDDAEFDPFDFHWHRLTTNQPGGE